MNNFSKAKAHLLIDNPFYGLLALQLEYTEDSNIDTAATDGVTMFYNPDFFNSLTVSECKGIILHELHHIIFNHCEGIENRNPLMWNMATDYVINPIVKQTNTLPEGALDDSKYHGMTAPQVYRVLEKESTKNNQGQGDNQDNNQSNNQSNNQNGKQSQGNQNGKPGKLIGDVRKPSDKAKAQARQKIAQAATAAKMQGELPKDVERQINKILYPRLPWHDLLREYAKDTAKNDYSWKIPNRKLIHRGIYLPSRYSQELDNLTIAVDTSGSMGQSELDLAAGAIAEIQALFNCNVEVIYNDARIQHVEKFGPGDKITLHPKGGGGTNFKPVFEYIKDTTCLIFISDGMGTFPNKIPEYPVIWVATHEFNPPFGRYIKVE